MASEMNIDVLKGDKEQQVFESFEEVASCLRQADRETTNARLEVLLQEVPRSSTEELLQKHLKGEQFHVTFVRKAMESLTGKASQHDWSKDLVYMVTAGLAFSFKRADLVEGLLDREIKRHYELEGHHPENMSYTKKLMPDEEILEMAVDRLSRNLQFNQGKADLQQMLSFEPKMKECPVCGHEASSGGGKCSHEEDFLKTYWSCVHKHLGFVSQLWTSMVDGQMIYL